jgi:hypothetical protein
MARVLHGPDVGDVRGSVGNMKHSQGHYGSFVSVKRPPCRRTTAATTSGRARFGEVSRAWGRLGAAEQAAWATWAAVNPVRDCWGGSRSLGARGAFCEVNCRLASFGLPQMDLPPTVPAPGQGWLVSVVAESVPQAVQVAFDFQFTQGLEWAVVWCSVTTGRKVRRWQDSLKQIGYLMPQIGQYYTCTSLVVERFGTLIAGQRVVVWSVPFYIGSGLYGPGQMAETTVLP